MDSRENLPESFFESRELGNEKLNQIDNLEVKRFLNLDTRVYEEGVLSSKTKEMMGLLASIVSRCDDCIFYHLEKCQKQGVSRAELSEIFSIALIVGGSVVIPHLRKALIFLDQLEESDPREETKKETEKESAQEKERVIKQGTEREVKHETEREIKQKAEREIKEETEQNKTQKKDHHLDEKNDGHNRNNKKKSGKKEKKIMTPQNEKEDKPAEKIKIYTDGSCKGNPGPGGYAAVIYFDNRELQVTGFVENTTNNRMELLAVINALERIDPENEIAVYSDSSYFIKGAQEWLPTWQKNGWKTSGGNPVKNQDLWQQIADIIDKYNPKLIKVRAHSDNKKNQLVDKLARKMIKDNIG